MFLQKSLWFLLLIYHHSTAVLIFTRHRKNIGRSTLDNMFDIRVYLVGKAI